MEIQNYQQTNQLKQKNTILILVSVLLLITLAIGFLIYKWQLNKLSGVPQITNDFESNTEKNTSIDNDSEIKIFYYTTKKSAPEETTYKIFRVSLNFDEKDINTHSFTIPGDDTEIITNPWKKNTILFISNSDTQAAIYSLDISSENLQPQILLTIPLKSNEDDYVADAKFIDNGNSIAFITLDYVIAHPENSILHIVSLDNKTKEETYFLDKRGPLYSSFGFLKATPDYKTIYLHQSGGDAGVVLSEWYKVDRISKTVQKLEKLPPIPKGEDNPATFAFNPDATKLAYADYSTVISKEDLEIKSYFGSKPCLRNEEAMQKYESEGGTIMIYDLKTGSTTEIFRNLSHPNNFCKNIARKIIDLKWLDNSTLAFETIDGIYTIDINKRHKKTLFSFEPLYSSPAEQNPPSILLIKMPYIVFGDFTVIQTETRKQLEFLNFYIQNGRFFILP